jgi:transcriptional regulator with XRE-family HTH domain
MENDFLLNIKSIRTEKGISQNQMAEKLGFAQSNYNKIENGVAELTVKRLYEIAKILEVSVLKILGEGIIQQSNEEEIIIDESVKQEVDNTLDLVYFFRDAVGSNPKIFIEYMAFLIKREENKFKELDKKGIDKKKGYKFGKDLTKTISIVEKHLAAQIIKEQNDNS